MLDDDKNQENFLWPQQTFRRLFLILTRSHQYRLSSLRGVEPTLLCCTGQKFFWWCASHCMLFCIIRLRVSLCLCCIQVGPFGDWIKYSYGETKAVCIMVLRCIVINGWYAKCSRVSISSPFLWFCDWPYIPKILRHSPLKSMGYGYLHLDVANPYLGCLMLLSTYFLSVRRRQGLLFTFSLPPAQSYASAYTDPIHRTIGISRVDETSLK